MVSDGSGNDGSGDGGDKTRRRDWIPLNPDVGVVAVVMVVAVAEVATAVVIAW